MKDNTDNHNRVIGIIPARYESTRLPGKPLAEISGKPMIQWVVERSSQAASLSDIVVATDDERIMKTVRDFGGNAVMTPGDINSGTDRTAFVIKDLECDIIVNIQGDEPFIDPEDIDKVAALLINNDEYKMGTLVKRIDKDDDLSSIDTAKVVINKQWEALYFSRSPIPFNRDKQLFSEWIKDNKYFKHIGIYSYRRNFLLQYPLWDTTPLEDLEKLEQLRALEMGFKILVDVTKNDSMCVDTPADLEKARELSEKYVSKPGS